jgi:hypothetical protein
MGTLAGQVTWGPVSPVERPGIKPSRPPAPGVTLMIYGPDHQEVARVVTEESGHFRV